jgi:hypothetical protein
MNTSAKRNDNDQRAGGNREKTANVAVSEGLKPNAPQAHHQRG